MARNIKLEITRGSSKAFGLTITNEGKPYALREGETLVFGLKKDPRDEKCVLLKPITNSIDGEYYLEMTPGDTANLEPGLYHYDIGLQIGKTVFYKPVELSDFLIKPNASKCGDV